MQTAIKLNAKDARPMLKLVNLDREYTGRTFRLEITDRYFSDPERSGGTFSDVRAVIQEEGDLRVIDLSDLSPFDLRNHGMKRIPDNVLIVAHEFFCGKDCGIRFYMTPNSTFRSKQLRAA